MNLFQSFVILAGILVAPIINAGAPPGVRTPGTVSAFGQTMHYAATAVHRAAPTPGSTPVPGLYASVPFTAIVVVPAPIDPQFVVRPRDCVAAAQVIQPPPTMLVPLRR